MAGRPQVSRWVLRTRTLHFGTLPRLMGIVNVTPDSFSDGGQFLEPSAAIDRALSLVAQGADIIDIGGESTRPYSTPVTADEELRRVMPVIAAVADRIGVPISIDTSKAAVAREAIQAGAEIINDVTGLTGDPRMVSVAVETQAAVCIMHMQGTPQTMQLNPTYQDVLKEVCAFLRDRRDALAAAGIPPERMALDPGIGFGKTTEHNLRLLRNAWQLHELGCPILVGHSRKGFITRVAGGQPVDPTGGTIGVALALARQGVQLLRVHDVGLTRQALLLFEATGGLD